MLLMNYQPATEFFANYPFAVPFPLHRLLRKCYQYAINIVYMRYLYYMLSLLCRCYQRAIYTPSVYRRLFLQPCDSYATTIISIYHRNNINILSTCYLCAIAMRTSNYEPANNTLLTCCHSPSHAINMLSQCC